MHRGEYYYAQRVTMPAYWSPPLTCAAIFLGAGYHWYAVHHALTPAWTSTYFAICWLLAQLIYCARSYRFVPSLHKRMCITQGELKRREDHGDDHHNHDICFDGNCYPFDRAFEHLFGPPLPDHSLDVYVLKNQPTYWYIGEPDGIDIFMREHKPYRYVIHDTPDYIGLFVIRLIWLIVIPLALWLAASTILSLL